MRSRSIRHTSVSRRRAPSFKVSASGIMLHGGRIRRGETLDLRIDGRRIWSFHATPRRGRIVEPWPEGLRHLMRGKASFSLARPGDAPFVEGTFALGDAAGRITVADAAGRDMVVDKWGGLTTPFAANDPSAVSAVLDLANVLVRDLQAAGHDVMITSGTLLGSVRNGELLPNDDDVDLAVVVSTSQSPADVASETLSLRRELESRGYAVLMHSAAHIQVHLPPATDQPPVYCDIFVGFFRGDTYCQPFHLRDVVPRDSLLPPVPVQLGGHSFPAPPRPADWLRACYGEQWERPDPGFTFQTPRATRDRYENWFGSFNFGRDFWDAATPRRQATAAHRRAVLDATRMTAVDLVIDAGCGDGWFTEQLRSSCDLVAFDFSTRAIGFARERLRDTATVLPVNLADRSDVLEIEVMATRNGAVLSLHDVLHTLIVPTRRNTLELARSALRAGGTVIASFPTQLSSEYAFEDPSSWHLPLEQLQDESKALGLRVEEIASTYGSDSRIVSTVSLSLDTDGTGGQQ